MSTTDSTIQSPLYLRVFLASPGESLGVLVAEKHNQLVSV